MALEPVLPLDRIDPNTCLHDATAIDAMIPHRGPIRQVDRIVFAETPLMIAGVKEVRDDEFWCDGHIPGRPVMPGVLQLEAGAQLASILDTLCHGPDRFMGLVRIDEASFRGSVQPGDQLLLLGDSSQHTKDDLCATAKVWSRAISSLTRKSPGSRCKTAP